MKKATIKIKRKYNDTELKRLVSKGEQLEVSLERAKVLCDKGFADVVEVSHKEVTPFFHPLNEKSKKELVEIAKEKGIKVTGLKKKEIIDKLLEL